MGVLIKLLKILNKSNKILINKLLLKSQKHFLRMMEVTHLVDVIHKSTLVDNL